MRSPKRHRKRWRRLRSLAEMVTISIDEETEKALIRYAEKHGIHVDEAPERLLREFLEMSPEMQDQVLGLV